MNRRTSLVPRTSLSNNDVYSVLLKHYSVQIGDKEVSEQVKTKLMMVAQWLLSDGEKRSLLLLGGVGNGKTSMVWAVYNSLKFLRDFAFKGRTKEEEDALKPLIKIPIPSVYKAIKIVNKASEDPTTVKNLKDEGFIAIDDIGVEPTEIMNFGSRFQPIVDIIYGRYDNRKPTIYTTNLDWSDMQVKYGPRVVDRLKEECLVIAYTEASFRTGVQYERKK